MRIRRLAFAIGAVRPGRDEVHLDRHGKVVEDPVGKRTFRRLDVKAALDWVFQNGNTSDRMPK